MHVLVFAVGIKVVVTSTNCKLGCSKNPEQVPPPHQLQIAEYVKEILQLFFLLQIKKEELSEDGSGDGAKFNKSNRCQHQHLLFMSTIKFVQLQQLISISTLQLTNSNNESKSTSTQILQVCNPSESRQNQHGIKLRVQQQNTFNDLGTSDWKWPRDLENKLLHSYNIWESGSRTLSSFANSSDSGLTSTKFTKWMEFIFSWFGVPSNRLWTLQSLKWPSSVGIHFNSLGRCCASGAEHTSISTRWSTRFHIIENSEQFSVNVMELYSLDWVSLSLSSEWTLQRRVLKFGLVHLSRCSEISDEELDEKIGRFMQEHGCFVRSSMFSGYLRSEGLRVQQDRICKCLSRIDP